MKYIICYLDGIPFLSIPTNSKNIDEKIIRDDYHLDESVVIKLEDRDKFIGW